MRKSLRPWLLLLTALLIGAGIAIIWIKWQDHSEYYRPPMRTKTAGCIIRHALPDPACTPGAVDTSVTKERLCAQSTKERRHTLASIQRQAFASYGFSRDDEIKREDDHLISLELGGADNDIANHFPQVYEDAAALKAGILSDDELGAHAKDKVENWLKRRVCKEELALAEAQRMIATNWITVYHEYEVRPKPARRR